MTADRFQSRLRLLIGAAWGIPPVFGIAYLIFVVRMFSPADMARMLTAPLLPTYIVLTPTVALWYFSRFGKPIAGFLESGDGEAAALETARRFPRAFWGTFLAYLVVAPLFVWASAVLATDLRPTPVDWLRIWLTALIVSIIVGLPIFFLLIDLIGKALADVPIERPHITIQRKVFLIAALVPLLIDTMLVQYYWTETGHFTPVTFAVWAGLEGLAVLGAILFVRSFRQSLAPLQVVVEQRGLDEGQLVPASTDELGVLTRRYRALVRELARRTQVLELRNRVLTSSAQSEDSAELTESLLALVRTVTGARTAGLFVVDGESARIQAIALAGPEGPLETKGGVRLWEPSLLATALASAAAVSADVASDPLASAEAARVLGSTTALLTPMPVGRMGSGVLACGFDEPPPEATREDLDILASEGGAALEKRLRDEDRESLREQVLHAQRLEGVGRLAGGVAHDFNNILTIIVSSCSLIEKRGHVGDEARAYLREISEATRHGSELTGQLLAFSRKQVTRPEVLDPNAVVTAMAKLLYRLLPDRVQLELQLAADVGPIEIDRIQLEQVLLNLVVNARDAIPGAGRIVIRSMRDEGLRRAGVCIEVSDTGIGIPADVLRWMFEPFFTTKGDRGTGLGLATVQAIVEGVGGSIEPTSEPGVGTTMTLRFPVAHAGRTPDRAPIGGAAPAALGILLVDDNPALRRILSAALRQEGHRVVEAADAEEALDLVARLDSRIDVLVTDVVMPGMTGPELAERLRQTNPDLDVLLVSGYADDASFQRAQTMGLPMLAKPFRPGDLIERLARLRTPV